MWHKGTMVVHAMVLDPGTTHLMVQADSAAFKDARQDDVLHRMMGGLLRWPIPYRVMITVCWGLPPPSLRQSRASYLSYSQSSTPSSSPSQHL